MSLERTRDQKLQALGAEPPVKAVPGKLMSCDIIMYVSASDVMSGVLRLQGQENLPSLLLGHTH